jgi:hypothetical protein
MVEEGEGCIIWVEHLRITKVANPRILHNSLDEDLDTALSGLKSLVVLDLGSPGGFGANAVDARSFCVDCRVIACGAGGWAYKGSIVVMEVPVLVGNESPEVVDAVDVVVGGLEKNRQDGIGETDKNIVRGLSIDWEEESLGCCKG